MKTSLTFLIASVLLYTACKHEMINPLPGNPQDTVVVNNPNPAAPSDTVCFNTEVLPLFITYCASAGCHDPVSRKEGVVTNTYTSIMRGITAKNPNKSDYYKVIIDKEMPLPGSPQLSTAQTNVILKWINQGALNTNCVNSCDTTKFAYSDPVVTLLTNNCNGCHGTKPGSGNVYLGDFASAKAYISANKTNFLNAINHTSTMVSKRMPPGNKLQDCQIGQFTRWVEKGFPQ
jgi:uncharacterized membrane protein